MGNVVVESLVVVILGVSLCSIAIQIGLLGIYSKLACKRGSAQKHPKTHAVAIGQGHLYRVALAADHQGGTDDIALLFMTSRVGHRAGIHHWGFAADAGNKIALDRVHFKANPRITITFKGLYQKGVQR